MTETGPILFAMTHTLAGGLREIWNDVAEGLAARGHRVGRFVLYPPDDPAGQDVDFATWYHVGSKPRSPLGALKLFLALIRYLRRERPVAIITAMPAANVVIPLAVTLAGVPTRVFLSHHSPTDTHNQMLDRIDGWTGCLACVAGVISVSNAVAVALANKPAAYRAKRLVIHNALPTRIEALLDSFPPHGGAGQGLVRIIALGRLTRQKNYPMLLRAMVEVKGAHLEIVGSGEDEAALRQLVEKLGIRDRVTFAGLVPREAALAKAAAADLFVQVSLFEGHSLALIEAARLGLPLIVSDVAVQVEGITASDGTQCGIVVQLGDHAMLAERINQLVADPAAREEWSRQARRLGAEASNERMLDRYETMLATAAAPR